MYLMGVSLLVTNYNWVSESILTFSNLPSFVAWGCVVLYALAFAIPFWMVGWASALESRTFWTGMALATSRFTGRHRANLASPVPYYHGALFYRSDITWQLPLYLGSLG